MAPITKSLALAGAFFALTGYAAPVAKRAVVWETVTDIVWTTVDVTTTIYPNSAPTATVVPVATPVVSTTSAAAVVTPTETPDETLEETPEVKQAVVAPSSSTPAPTPAPVVQADTSSAAPAPAPTEESSAVPVPAPATSIVETAAARSSNPDTTPSTAPSSGYTGACSEGAPCDGMITFYDTATLATNPSSCGNTNDGTIEDVLALPHGIMKEGDCGKTVTITYNGQTATGTVVDKCMGCDNTSIDLSRALFGKLASFDRGRVSGAKWYIH